MEPKDVLAKLIEWVETASPQLWAIALQQVQAQIYQHIYTMVVLCVFLILFVVLTVWLLKIAIRLDHDMASIGGVISFITLLFLLVALFEKGHKLIALLVNPEYAAIKVLMNLVSK